MQRKIKCPFSLAFWMASRALWGGTLLPAGVRVPSMSKKISLRSMIETSYLYSCSSQAKPPAGRTTAPALRGQPAIRSV